MIARAWNVLVAVGLLASFTPAKAQAAPVAASPLFCAYSKPVGGESPRTAIVNLEAKVGRPFAAHKDYMRWDSKFPARPHLDDAKAGRVPYVSWTARRSGTNEVVLWSDIASGSEDTTITAMASAVKNYGKPVVLIFHHEPDNGDSQNNGSAADFVNAFRHIREVFDGVGVTNVTWEVTLMAATYDKGKALDYYPGDAYVDHVGVDGYNWYPGVAGSKWRSFEEIFAPAQQFAASLGKPLAISETGVQEDPNDPNRKAQWFRDALSTMKAWNVASFCYFNSDKSYPWWVDSSQASLDAYTEVGKDPYFASPSAQADLSVTKTDSADPVTLGDQLTYTLTVSNHGPASGANTILTDTLPAQTSFVSAVATQGTCANTNGARAIMCELGSLGAGETATATIVVKTDATGTIANTAFVASTSSDPDPADLDATTIDNHARETTVVQDSTASAPPPSADLALAKAASPEPVATGADLTYTLTVVNNGPDGATGVTIADTLPSGTTFSSASTGCTHSSGVVTCDVGSLPANDQASAVIKVTAPTSAGEVTNTASAKGKEDDPAPGNNSASVTSTVVSPDTEPPTVPSFSQPTARFQKQTAFGVAWSSSDTGSGVATYDVRVRVAPYNAGFGAFADWMVATAATSATYTGTPGNTYCFSARATDSAGNTSTWSQDRCTALPVDDPSLSASGSWRRSTGSDYYLGTYSASTKQGSSLVLKGVQAKQLAVLVTKCPKCGTLHVLWNGVVIKKISLYSSTTVKKYLVALTPFDAVSTGTVSLKVASSGKKVEVDALGVTRA